MSKVEITGPRDTLLAVLETIERAEVLQIDPGIKERIDEGAALEVRPLALDGRTLAERLFLEDLGIKVGRLLELLPKVESRESYLSASRSVNSIAAVVGRHVEAAEERARRRDALQAELGQLSRYVVFLTTVESLVPKGPEAAGLEFIGVEVRDPAALEQLTRVAGRLLLGAEVRTARAEDGSYIGLLTTEKDLAAKLKEGLRGNHIPEIALPAYLEGLSLPDKLKATRARQDALTAELAAIDNEARDFAVSWRGLYVNVQDWLRRRLTLLRTSASVYETDRCFVLYGWMPSASVDALRKSLAARHGDTVIVEEREILQKELDEVPVALRADRRLRAALREAQVVELPGGGGADVAAHRPAGGDRGAHPVLPAQPVVPAPLGRQAHRGIEAPGPRVHPAVQRPAVRAVRRRVADHEREQPLQRCADVLAAGNFPEEIERRAHGVVVAH